MGKSNQLPRGNRHSITTIVTLLSTIRYAFPDTLKRLAKAYDNNRPEEQELNSLYGQVVEMWELLREHVPAFGDVMGSDPIEEKAFKFRHPKGGHMLFRPIGQLAFARVLSVLQGRGVPLSESVAYLCRGPLQLTDIPWDHVLWDSGTDRIISANRPVAQELLLHMVGHEPHRAGFDLRGTYQGLYGDRVAPFDDIPVNPLPVRPQALP